MIDHEFMELCREAFRRGGQNEIKIAYGVDNLLWRRHEKVCQVVGVQPAELTATYHAHGNPYLTGPQMSQVAHARANPELFKRIKFDKGAETILRPQALSPQVSISLLDESYKPEIFEMKVSQLLKVVDGLERSRIRSHILTRDDNVERAAPDGTTILVSANPHVIQTSTAIVNVLPNWLNWAKVDTAKQAQELEGKNVIWKSSLAEINEFVYEMTKFLLNNGTAQ